MRRVLSLVVALLLSMGLLSGCSNPESNRPAEPSSAAYLQKQTAGGGGNIPPLEPIDLSRVVVEISKLATRTPEEIANGFGLVLLEVIGPSYAVLQGSYTTSILLADPDIVAAAPNEAVRPQGSDYGFGFFEGNWSEVPPNQSAFQGMQLGTMHTVGRGAGVRVLVPDTGVDPSHPLLEPRVELVDSGAFGVGSVEPKPKSLAEAPAFGHGTHVAGIVAQVAPEATLIPVRILDETGQGSLQDFVRAMSIALDPAMNIDIVSLSMSTSQPVDLVQRIMNKLNGNKIAVVAAAGNYEPGQAPPPPSPLAIHGPVFGVVAIDHLDVLAEFSRFGPLVDFAAPGVQVLSSYPTYGSQPHGYSAGSGTSFSTPIVSGSIACIMEVGGYHARKAANQLRNDVIAISPVGSVQHGKIDPAQTALNHGISGGWGITP